MRKITDERQTASIFLSKENYDILDNELNKNFNININNLKADHEPNKKIYKVRVLPPLKTIKIKKVWHDYKIIKKEYIAPVEFDLTNLDMSKYESIIYEKNSIFVDTSLKKSNIDFIKEQREFSKLSLVCEIAKYLNISCILVNKILVESVDGIDNILSAVNKYNEILNDVIIFKIFHTIFDVKTEIHTEDKEVLLLREPINAGYYEFSAKENLVVSKATTSLDRELIAKSFHADTYCFDSLPEKECFYQYIMNDDVTEIYFTGMFTANQGDLSVQYYDPESGRIRNYYPDFLAKMKNGSYQLIEVKGDNKIDDNVVKAKAQAASELAVLSGIEYKMYASSDIMSRNILDN